MAPLTQFHCFGLLPPELRSLVWKQDLMSDRKDRIVPVTRDTKRVMITRDLLSQSRIFNVCHDARDAAKEIYDLEIPVVHFYNHTDDPVLVMHPNWFTGEEIWEAKCKAENDQEILFNVHVSSKLDTFYVTSLHQTFGQLRRSEPELMSTPIPPMALSKMQCIMEVAIDRRLKKGSEASIEPRTVCHQFDREVFAGARSCAHIIKRFNNAEHSILNVLCGVDKATQDLYLYVRPIICTGL
ncbi:potassium transporter 12 [Apiospora arundinis]